MHFLRLVLAHLFRNYVYYHFMFPKINKGGVGIRVGGWKIFQKLRSGGGGTIIPYSRVHLLDMPGINLQIQTNLTLHNTMPEHLLLGIIV